MTIKNIIETLDRYNLNGEKLYAVKMINEIRGGGLRESKDIVDTYFKDINFGKNVISHLKEKEEWKKYKSNIRKLKE